MNISTILGSILTITGMILTLWLISNIYFILFPIGSIGMTMIGIFLLFNPYPEKVENK